MAESRPKAGILCEVTDLSHLDNLQVDGLALFVYAGSAPHGGIADLLDWRLQGKLGRAQAQGQFLGGLTEQLLLPAPARTGAAKVFVFGLGDAHALAAEPVRQRLQEALTAMAGAGVRRAALILPKAPQDRQRHETEAGGPCPEALLEEAFLDAGAGAFGHIIAKVLRHRID